MAYEQTKQFFPKEMGKAKGWCLKNCRVGFRIYTGHYASAKTAMEAGKKNGFLPAKGYWCRYDQDERVAKLADFMYKTFPAYTNKKALGSLYGDNLWKSIKEFQKRTGLYPDGNTGKITYSKLKEYGFKY